LREFCSILESQSGTYRIQPDRDTARYGLWAHCHGGSLWPLRATAGVRRGTIRVSRHAQRPPPRWAAPHSECYSYTTLKLLYWRGFRSRLAAHGGRTRGAIRAGASAGSHLRIVCDAPAPVRFRVTSVQSPQPAGKAHERSLLLARSSPLRIARAGYTGRPRARLR